jgi:transcriptional regulator with XRE-family HTH domain
MKTSNADFLLALGHVIRMRRKELNMIQLDLAKRADLHRTYLADIERGTRNVSVKNLLRLADALGVALSIIFAETESRLANGDNAMAQSRKIGRSLRQRK